MPGRLGATIPQLKLSGWTRFVVFTGALAPWKKIGGMSDGGKWVCGVDTLLQRSGCVVYSIGSAGKTSFEEAVLRHTACTVRAFDPTLDAATTAKVTTIAGLNFTSVGLSDVDGEQVIGGVMRPVRTLRTLMRERGHAWIDVLRLDIEGSEWRVLDALVREGMPLPVTQAQIEFHLRPEHANVKPPAAIETLAGLSALGMKVFHVEENNYCPTCAGCLYELAFAHVDQAGALVTYS